MEISNVTHDDALRAGQLANFIKAGKWQMDGETAATFTRVVQWYHALCTDMARKLPQAAAAAPAAPVPAAPSGATGFKIKSITPAAPSAPTKTRKK